MGVARGSEVPAWLQARIEQRDDVQARPLSLILAFVRPIPYWDSRGPPRGRRAGTWKHALEYRKAERLAKSMSGPVAQR